MAAFEKDGKIYILSILGSRNLWGDTVNILQEIYPEVPSRRDISLAKARSHVVLASYHITTAGFVGVKRHERRYA
ncbi:MAG: hypothetical protein ABSD38_20435 [Syntrophorhabdales bacterium]